MGKRYAIVIGVAAAGVMALGAQTAAAAPDAIKYDTELTIAVDRGHNYHGYVNSEARRCQRERRVILFKVRPGVDRKLGATRTQVVGGPEYGTPRFVWWLLVHFPTELQHGDVYAKVPREAGDGFVCRPDRSKTLTRPGETDRSETLGVSGLGVPAALGAQTAAAARNVVEYDTKVTLRLHNHERFIYWVQSEGRRCERGRRVVLFQVQPGADRKVGAARSEHRSGPRRGEAVITARGGGAPVWYAKVSREVHDGFVCGGDRSEVHDDR